MATQKSKKQQPVDVFDLIEDMARRGESVQAGLSKLARACRASGMKVPTAVPKAALDHETKRLEKWFRSLWVPKAPPKSANALYFGIGEFSDGSYDLYCLAVPGKGEVEGWQFNRSSSPKDKYAHSELFAFFAPRKGSASAGEVRHVMSLGYGVLMAAHLCRSMRSVLAARAPLVAAGYDEGDIVELGKLQPNGTFEAPAAKPSPGPMVIPKKGNILELEDTRGEGGTWILDICGPGGRDLPYEFASSGKRVKKRRFEAEITSRGKPADISFTNTGVLMVSQRVGDILEQHAPTALQRLPVAIPGVKGSFEIANVIRILSCNSLLKWGKQTRSPVANASMGRTALARTGRVQGVVVVNRALAEALAAAGVTGTKFVPLAKSELTPL